MKKQLILFTALALLALPSAQADLIAVTDAIGGSATGEGIDGTTRGWGFIPTTDIFLTAFGVWDSGSDGFASEHQVGIWDATETLLGSTTVLAGTGSASSGPVVQGGVFRFESLAPILLSAGTQYFIGAQYFSNGDTFLNFVDTTVTDAIIDANLLRRAHFGSFDFPELDFDPDGGYFGPNFMFTIAVSEPPVLLLMVIGFAGLALRRKVLRNKR